MTEATEQFDAAFKPVWTRWTVAAVVAGILLFLAVLLVVLQRAL